MRILIVHARYRGRGGEDVVAENEARLLRDAGHDVAFLEAPAAGSGWLSELRVAGTAVWSARAYATVKRRCIEHWAQVVHVHNFFPALSPSVHYAAASAGAAVVQTLHNFRLLCIRDCFVRERRPCTDCLGRAIPYPGLLHACYRGRYGASAVLLGTIVVHRALRTWKRIVDGYIAPTEGVRRRFVDGGYDESRIHVKYHSVERPPSSKPVARNGAVLVGRLTSEKGVDRLIQAWRGISAGVRLSIIGDGPDRAYLESISRGVAGVEFLGAVSHDEAIHRIRAARTLVFPSVGEESFGLAVAEACACGTPVVAFDHGSARELVSDGVTGWLVPFDNIDLLTTALRSAVEGEQESARRGAQALRRYEAAFAHELTAPALEHIYKCSMDVCEARRRAGTGHAR